MDTKFKLEPDFIIYHDIPLCVCMKPVVFHMPYWSLEIPPSLQQLELQ